ncbi:MAG: hypothetical protein GY915_02625 [bacterium]|nr:hypothetical protein [bacterium]
MSGTQLHRTIQLITRLVTQCNNQLDMGKEADIDSFQGKLENLSNTLMSDPKLCQDPVLQNLMGELAKSLRSFHESARRQYNDLSEKMNTIKSRNDVLNTYLKMSRYR